MTEKLEELARTIRKNWLDMLVMMYFIVQGSSISIYNNFV